MRHEEKSKHNSTTQLIITVRIIFQKNMIFGKKKYSSSFFKWLPLFFPEDNQFSDF